MDDLKRDPFLRTVTTMDMGKTLLLLEGMALSSSPFCFIRIPFAIRRVSILLHSRFAQWGDLKHSQPTHGHGAGHGCPHRTSSPLSEYKAQREAMPEELAASIPWHRHVSLAALSFWMDMKRMISSEPLREGETEGFTTYRVTCDKDFSQLVTEHHLPARAEGGAAEVEGVQEPANVGR